MAFGFQPMPMPNVLGDLGSNLARSAQASTPQANPGAFMPSATSKPLFTMGDVKAAYQGLTGGGAPAGTAPEAAAPVADTGASAATDAGAGAAADIGGSGWSSILSAILGAL